MSVLPLLVYGVTLSVLWFLLRPLVSWNRRIPGPFLAKRTRWWYAWKVYQYNFHRTNQALHKKYGPIVEIMPGYFSINDPESNKSIYRRGLAWLKGESYEAWHVGPGLTNLFSERDPHRHAVMRRKVSAMYSMTSLVTYEPFVEHCIGLLRSQLDSFATSGSEFDLGSWMRYYAFDTVYMITFGERLGFLTEGKDIASLISRLDHTRKLHTFFSIFPWTMPLVHLWRRWTSGKRQLYHQKFASTRIEQIRSQTNATVDNGPTCIVKKMLAAQKSQDGKSETISDWDIAMIAGINVGAGSETTAITLSYTLFLIFQHRDMLRRLRDEIDSAELPDMPSFQALQQLQYLQAVIYEAMRIYPASGLPLWREVPHGGTTLGGQFFPAGRNIGVNAWVTNFQQNAYGTDVDIFRPERWIDNTTGKTKQYREETFLTFGAGSRTCIGKNVSLLEMVKLIPILVRDYDFTFHEQDGGLSSATSTEGRNMLFVKPRLLKVRCAKR